ncbi:MAG: hypothetical protein QXT19_04065 [Candidatus Woesearchaeota archaeon]
MTRYLWKLVDNEPSIPDYVTQEMRVHGEVYQLYRKGIIMDSPLPVYASFSRSRYEIKMQFGNNPTVCNVRDEDLARLKKFKKIDALFDRHKISIPSILSALPQHGHHAEHKNSFLLCLKRFVELYFRA